MAQLSTLGGRAFMQHLMRLFRARWLRVFGLVILVGYVASYYFRWEIGLIRPSANATYFYYSSETFGPVFRVVYYPAYKIHRLYQKLSGSSPEIYYEDRTDW